MIHGPIWILLFAIPSFLMVWVLFRVRSGAGRNEPKWIWYFLAALIAVLVSPLISIIGYYGILDELFGPDWLGLHPKGLGAPDPLFGPSEVQAWYLYGGVLGAALAILADHAIKKSAS